MIFTDKNIKALTPRERGYKVFDKSRTGLHLYISPTGAKCWRVRYWLDGQARIYSLGMYPIVDVKTARKLTIKAKRMAIQGVDPVHDRKERRIKVKERRLQNNQKLINESDEVMNLTNRMIQKLKPQEKGYSLWDRGRIGLHLYMSPQGSKLWRLRYTINGKPRVISIGDFKFFNVKEAREEAYIIRRMISRGVCPLAERKAAREAKQAAENTFKRIATEWFSKMNDEWSEHYRTEIKSRLEHDLYPAIGNRPIAEIKPLDLLRVIRGIEERCVGAAHRALQVSGAIFRFAVRSGLIESDPSSSLKGAIAPVNRGHFAAITNPIEVGELLRRIDGYEGSTIIKCALRILPYLFCRPGELRTMEWSEVDFIAAEWRISAPKMKTKNAHIVPLSRQVLIILEEVKAITGNSKYVFLSEQRYRGYRSYISENATNNALRRLGYKKDQMTSHGFRLMATSLLNEMGYSIDVIEQQLGLIEKNSVIIFYDKSNYMDERRKMMQEWADYLDSLRGVTATTRSISNSNDIRKETNNTIDDIDSIIDNVIREVLK